MTTTKKKLFNVVELLQAPDFPHKGFGENLPNSLRRLNEDLQFATDAEGICDALEQIESARDALHELFEESEQKAVVFKGLSEEVQKLEEEGEEELSQKKLDDLIEKKAATLWILKAKRFVEEVLEEEVCSHHFCDLAMRLRAEVEVSRAEVKSWFAIEGEQK
jgi:hypothetical protein